MGDPNRHHAESAVTIGSLFSGVGGLELGLEWAGLGPTIWQAERDPFCRKVLRERWPGVKCFGSVQEVRRERAARPFLLCGGFPCQPVSYAGRGLGERDERWLWPECARVARELEPEWCVFENVRGLLHRGLAAVLSDLADCGFDAEWFDLSAGDLGESHRRSRIWIVAHRSGDRLDRFRSEIERAVADAREARGLADAERRGVQLLGDAGFAADTSREARDEGECDTGIAAACDRREALANADAKRPVAIASARVHEQGQRRHDAARRNRSMGPPPPVVTEVIGRAIAQSE